MDEVNNLLHQIREEQVAQREQIKTLFNQQEENKKLTESVHELASSVKLLASAQKTTEKKVDGLSAEVEGIKEKPAKRWDDVVKTVITVIVTAFITYALTKTGLK